MDMKHFNVDICSNSFGPVCLLGMNSCNLKKNVFLNVAKINETRVMIKSQPTGQDMRQIRVRYPAIEEKGCNSMQRLLMYILLEFQFQI